MIQKNYDKILLGIALLVLLIAFVFSAFRPAPRSVTDFVDIPRIQASNTFQVSEPPEVDLEIAQWTPPGPQPAGPLWIYDLFTPPVIYYNAVTSEFTVRPPIDGPVNDDFGIQLVDVIQDLYRVQLLGYVGREGDYLITLENAETGELVMARVGREYEQLGISIRSFQVERVPHRHTGGTQVLIEVARAVIYDQRLDQEIELTSAERRKDDRPTAVFLPTEGEGKEIRARVGDNFNVGDFNYVVDSIEPPLATVTRINRAEQDERQTKTLAVTSRTQREPAGRSEAPAGAGQTPAPGRGQREQPPAQQPPPADPAPAGPEGEMDFAF